ncbi:MAG: substrate-binding domain-containing protein [Planctomycetota bacterium]|nr:substrate-binding domain-containing protein [Planctomycetota bacterium]
MASNDRRPSRGRPPSAQAEHRRVARAIRAQAAAGAWKAFENLPSVRALSKTHGASTGAVRLALEQLEGERIIARTARRRRHVLPRHAYAMDGGGIVLEVMGHPLGAPAAGSMHMELQRGILAGCGDAGAPLLIAHAHELYERQPDGFLDLPLKGILLFGRFTAKNLDAFERLTVPVCYVDTPSEGRRIHSVSVDNAAVTHDATRRLIEAGHRRIAFVQYVLYSLRDVDPDSKERKTGFLQACKDTGIPNAASRVFSYLSTLGPQPSLRALVNARPKITAAVCVDWSSANILAQEAAGAGVRIPQDLGIVCFQAPTQLNTFSGPAIDFFAIGRLAVPLLDHPPAPPVQKRVGTVWCERGSVLPLR